MTREIATQLADRADAEDLPSELREALKERMDEHLSRLDFERIVRDQRKRLWEGWTDRDRRLDLAPGTEILEDVFRNFDSRYNKSKDAKRVAENMDPDEIPEEVQVVLRRVATLTDRGR